MENPKKFLRGTVRKSKNGRWWRTDQHKWTLIQTPQTRRRKASQRRITRAKTIGMIKIFYSKPKKCNLVVTNQGTCYPTPRILATGWKLSNQLQPYSSKHKWTHIDEYMGPLNKMTATKRFLEKHFKQAQKTGYVLSYSLQANSLFEKYQGWGIA
jgi:hypothetical protein